MMKKIIKNSAKTTALYITNIVIFIVLLATVSACNKLPTADFKTNKTEYTAGETIQLESTSKKEGSIRWTLPDGTTSTLAKVSYPTYASGIDQILQFKLEAISKQGNKIDFIVKNRTVKAAKGKVTIYWKSSTSGGNFSGEFWVDGTSYGKIALPNHSEDPSGCDQAEYLTYELPIGWHVLQFWTSSTSSISRSVNITANDCSVVSFNFL